ncbi:MAG: YegS/Rv2252/BmrU family lipid kinase [Clostridiales Family XIII bacterium]|jgi:YegS/Rv2252/BmrU family lipid kinase|nr:YegS/Rv2252/BmrU family lipid kinase [Clostridiales Family XIII bacterium]
MADKVLLFYNPKAGNGVFSSNLDAVIVAFQQQGQVVVPIRAGREDILDSVFTDEGFKGYSKIIAAGGDGTVNIVVSAMVKYGIDIPLAIFPAGTANDLAYYFDIPAEIDEMLEIATGDNITPMDVGTVNGRCFVNVLAMGMIVDVSQKTDPLVKNTLGVMAYYLRGVAEIPKIRPIPVRLSTPDNVLDTEMNAMLVMNGRSAGGFKRVAPDASISDGLFDIVLFRDMPITNWGSLLMGLMTGQHTENKYVTHFRTDQLLIESAEAISTDMDGEEGEPLPLDVKILPGRIRVCTREDDMEGNSW